jgi:hypothetical protein
MENGSRKPLGQMDLVYGFFSGPSISQPCPCSIMPGGKMGNMSSTPARLLILIPACLVGMLLLAGCLGGSKSLTPTSTIPFTPSLSFTPSPTLTPTPGNGLEGVFVKAPTSPLIEGFYSWGVVYIYPDGYVIKRDVGGHGDSPDWFIQNWHDLRDPFDRIDDFSHIDLQMNHRYQMVGPVSGFQLISVDGKDCHICYLGRFDGKKLELQQVNDNLDASKTNVEEYLDYSLRLVPTATATPNLPATAVAQGAADVCQGQALPAAAEYQPGDGPHAILECKQGTCSPLAYADMGVDAADLEPAWSPKSIDELQLVVCLEQGQPLSAGVCNYSYQMANGTSYYQVKNMRRRYDYRLVIARTGKVLNSFFVYENQSSCPGFLPLDRVDEPLYGNLEPSSVYQKLNEILPITKK